MKGSARPTRFRGVMWNDGWEFDAPCALYSPVVREIHAGNTSGIDELVETVAFELSEGRDVPRIDDATSREFLGRQWSVTNLSRRRRAYHVLIVGKWVVEDGYDVFEPTHRYERFGAPCRGIASERSK
jgi:hypothetical protein